MSGGPLRMGTGSYASGLRVHRYMAGEYAEVGKYCSIAPDVEFICGGAHRTSLVSTWPFDPKMLCIPDERSRTYKHPLRPTTIGNDVWVSTGAMILDGVHVGDGAIVGPRAVVFEDVAPYEVVHGNPGRVVRMRHEMATVAALLRISWWDWGDDVVRARVEDFYLPVDEFVAKYLPLVSA